MRFAQIAVLLIPRAFAAVLLLTIVLEGETRADWPEGAITIIVPFPRGGATDMLGRLLAVELSQRLGQKITVKNVEGEVGNVGLRAAALAAPDGYTLLVTTNAALINLMINPKLAVTAYNTPKDLEPIAYLGAAPNVFVVRPSSDIGSVAQLIAQAKNNPGKLTCASPGVGSSSEVALELLKVRANIDIRNVTWDGSEPAVSALLSGVADLASIGIGGLIDHIHSGEVKALVQTGAERWFDLPDVPTMAEAGIPKAVVETSQMFAAPAGTPWPVINRLTTLTKAILQQSDITARMLTAGFRLQYEGPDELHARIMRELPIWKDLVEQAGLKKP
jgi:tripartite-type tricarboxylate transporter receptor subunit TctC